MSKPLLPAGLWARIEPLLPSEPPTPKGGRPRVPDRAALTGILFVLKPGIHWEYLPQEMGCSSGVTCWRRLRDWQEAEVWDRLHRTLLDRLGEAEERRRQVEERQREQLEAIHATRELIPKAPANAYLPVYDPD